MQQDSTWTSAQEVREFALPFSKQIAMMLGAFWQSSARNRILAYTLALLVIIFATVYGQYRLNQWNVPFFNALERRDWDRFVQELQVFGILGGSLLVLNVVQAWLNQITALHMREGLARDLIDLWLKPRRALRLAHLGAIGVNPDQRLHEDARNLAELTTSLAIGLVNSTILLASFVGVLWAISGTFRLNIGGDDVAIPGYMVWAAFLYAGLASLLSNVVGRRLPGLNADRYAKEAELRFALMHTNENLVAITLARGEESERRRVHGAISTVLHVIRRLAIGYTNLTWVSAGFGWLSTVAPILIASPVYFAGNLTFGGLMMAVGAFNQVNAALRWYVDNFRQIADWKATLMRVSTFRHALTMMEGEPQAQGVAYASTEDGTILLKGLELYAAHEGSAHNHGLRLLSDETFQRNERLMINGEAGADRRFLFQALAGAWEWGRGEIAAPPDGRMLFMPQKGYLPHASLRETLAYPFEPATFEDERLLEVLKDVGLSPLAAALDLIERWDRKLTEDDQVRLRVANALLIGPDWLVIDDVLEGLEIHSQRELAGILSQMADTGIIYIGDSPAFEEVVKPRRVHLHPLPTVVPARAHRHLPSGTLPE
ncbi:MAG: ABC transporter ATP-binding protein/permease [Pseudorhizobium sp.]